MEKTNKLNRLLILGSGVLVALYLIVHLSLYIYKPATSFIRKVENKEVKLPKEATLLNVAITYMVSIVGVKRE